MLRALFFLFFSVHFSFAQEIYSSRIDSVLKNHHNSKSITLHLHTNKTVYISDEKIWFSIYAFETESGKIASTKLNIVAQLVNENNEILSKSLLYINHGKTSGSFVLNPKVASNTYYIRTFVANGLDTNISEGITKAIKIINPDNVSEDSKPETELTYDIQILPEGGHLISEIRNSCGLKIINSNGKGVKFENLILKNQNGQIIKSNLSTNALGMGKFSFVPEEGKIYFIADDTKTIEKKLPKIEKIGLALKLEQDFKTGDLQLELTTNENSLPFFSNKKTIITIHKESLSNSYVTQFEKGYPKIIVTIPNKKLFTGTNTITIFNEDFKPIVERLFFNFQSIKSNTSFIREVQKTKDTFKYTIINKVEKETIRTNTSISVLPVNTIANNNRAHLFSSVYLKPFINGTIENPSYYFQKNNNQKRFEIDLLLLNQGWRKYSWKSIFKNENTFVDSIRAGITISGYVVPLKKEESASKVLLFSKENEAIKMVDLDKENKFSIHNLVFETGKEFEFSAINNQGKPIKANFFFITKPLSKSLKKTFDLKPIDPFFSMDFNIQKSLQKFEGELLDEVVVTAEKLKFKKFTQGRYGVAVDSTLFLYGDIGDYFKIKEDLVEKVALGDMFNPPGPAYFYRSGERASFFIDGVRASLINGLLRIPMENVSELYHGGKRSSHLIFTNGKKLEIPERLKTAKKFKLNTGFTFEKEIYEPKYTDFESESYQKYASVSWHQDIKSNRERYNIITLTNPGFHDLLFYIEGFTETGDPFTSITPVKQNTSN